MHRGGAVVQLPGAMRMLPAHVERRVRTPTNSEAVCCGATHVSDRGQWVRIENLTASCVCASSCPSSGIDGLLGRAPGQHTLQRMRSYVPFHPSRRFLPIPGASAACGVAPLADTEARVGCSMDSSCELLSSLDPASGSCEEPCRTARSISKHQGGRTETVSQEVCGSLRKPARCIGGCGCGCVEADRALL